MKKVFFKLLGSDCFGAFFSLFLSFLLSLIICLILKREIEMMRVTIVSMLGLIPSIFIVVFSRSYILKYYEKYIINWYLENYEIYISRKYKRISNNMSSHHLVIKYKEEELSVDISSWLFNRSDIKSFCFRNKISETILLEVLKEMTHIMVGHGDPDMNYVPL